jgi:hypothetical protein
MQGFVCVNARAERTHMCRTTSHNAVFSGAASRSGLSSGKTVPAFVNFGKSGVRSTVPIRPA